MLAPEGQTDSPFQLCIVSGLSHVVCLPRAQSAGYGFSPGNANASELTCCSQKIAVRYMYSYYPDLPLCTETDRHVLLHKRRLYMLHYGSSTSLLSSQINFTFNQSRHD